MLNVYNNLKNSSLICRDYGAIIKANFQGLKSESKLYYAGTDVMLLSVK